jgi:tRNA(adenine34) deaminase
VTQADDEHWMRRALTLAEQAADAGEVPVGAVCVADGDCLGEGWNAPIGEHDPTAHAEIRALRAAARQRGNYRLPGVTLYVTIEPCAMCVGAIMHARIERLVYGAAEPRAGAVSSAVSLLNAAHFNHRVAVTAGVLAGEARARMQAFFRARRGAG